MKSDPDTRPDRLEITAGATRWRANEWEEFVKYCEKKEIKPTDQIRRLVRDFLAKRLFTLANLNPETIVELERWGEEHGISMQAAAERIIGDFCSASMRQRKAARQKSQ